VGSYAERMRVAAWRGIPSSVCRVLIGLLILVGSESYSEKALWVVSRTAWTLLLDASSAGCEL
jgi:hypothetical protein